MLYFFAGIGIGAVPFGQGLLAADGGLARRWPVWLTITLVSYGCIIGLIYIKRGILPDVNHQPYWWTVAYPLAFATYSAAQTFNIVALFLRFDNEGPSIFDPLRDSAYGIYLIHYMPVLWLQYVLFDVSLAPVMQVSAILKAVIVFVVTLATSWAATAALRRLPGATHVL